LGFTSKGRFELPDDFLLRSAVIYGAPESGKTTTATVIAEEAWRTVHIPFVALDPKGDWWGVKSSRDGKTAGIPAIIFGGDHADLPLDENAPATIAAVVARLEQPVIIDLEHLSKGKQIRFVATFLEKLYELNRRPRLLIADEAQRWAPQKPISPDHTICLGATEDIAKLGRKHGLGRLFVTQRGAGFNKEVAELMDVMIAHRTPGVLDQERVRDWLQANMGKLAVDAVMGSKTSSEAPVIAGLRKGEVFIASAHPDMKMFERIQVRDRTTFDSSATPGLGKKRTEPKVLAQPDLEALRTEMSDTIQRAKQDDPKELRKQLAEAKKQITVLTRDLAAIEASPARVVEKVEQTEKVKPISEELLNEIQHDADFVIQAISLLTDGGKRMGAHWMALHQHNETAPETTKMTLLSTDGAVSTWPQAKSGSAMIGYDLKHPGDPYERVEEPTPLRNALRTVAISKPSTRGTAGVREMPAGSSVHPDLKWPQKKILDALAWMESIGQRGSHWTLVAMLAQQSPKSSGFVNNVSVLRVNGFLEGNRGSGLTLTDAGRSIAVAPDVPLTTDEMLAAIKGKITAPQHRILWFLARKGEPVIDPWEKVAEHSQQSPTSSGFVNNVSVLRSMGLLRGNRGTGLEATTILFLDRRS
jgi:hypothetical protein